MNESLTKRQLEVLRYAARGFSAAETGERLENFEANRSGSCKPSADKVESKVDHSRGGHRNQEIASESLVCALSS